MRPKMSPASAPGSAPESLRRELDGAVRLHHTGDVVRAAEIYQRILAASPEHDPEHAEAMNYLGFAACDLGQTDKAVELAARSIELRPDVAFFHNNFGKILKRAGRREEAAEACRRAVGIDPNFADAWNALGQMLADQGRLTEAMDAARQAIELCGDFPEAHQNMANIYFAGGDYKQAERSYRRAIGARPTYAEAYNNLGAALNALNRVTEAEAAHLKAVELQPHYPVAHGNLAGVRSKLGRLDDAYRSYRISLGQDGTAAHVRSSLILTMGLDWRCSPDEILAESRLWNQHHAAPLAARAKAHPNDRDPARRLRIGYVSGDFRDHAVSHFTEPLFAAHHKEAVELFGYSHAAVADETTRRIGASMDHWCDTASMTQPALAERIRSDRIDILVDLAGHTEANRLLAFAERPAPVQAAWLGFGGTTGLDAMDYRLTDAIADPQGPADAQHSETLVRLPGGFLCYQPPADAPEIGPPPCADNGHITFASFNDLSKVTPQALSVWARVLHAVPGARLMIKGRPFAEAAIRRRYLDIFKAEGIDRDRIELVAQFPSRQAYLENYKNADIVLDSFPYNGGATTCEALWMGAPVVTLAGDRHVSRMAASMLARVGLADLAAGSEDEYVAIAARLAGDPARLAELRAGLRGTMAASTLCDGPAFARAMEAAYRDMWRKWCETVSAISP